MAELLYFAKDGSYGDASDLTILNTERWSEEDLVAVEEASDMTRLYTALKIANEISYKRILGAIQGNEEA